MRPVAGEELRAEKLLATDPEAALGILIETWRQTFDPALGRLIEQLGASLAQPLEGLPIKKGERATALTKLIFKASHAERSGLLAAFEDFAREAPGRLVWPPIDAWASAKRDPRVARMALRVLTTLAHNLTAKLWRRLVNCIEEHGDLGVVEDARAYEAMLKGKGSRWGFSPERFSNVLKKLTKARQCKLAADASVIEAMSKRIGARPTAPKLEDPSEMLAAIGEHPDDDGPRLVYADWLLERKQPAGEFIVLQIARSKSKVSVDARSREADLLATHRTALLGPFDGLVAMSGLKFERGFLVAAEAERLPAHPFNRLLRRVKFREGFAKGAQFDSLEEAVGPDLPNRDRLPALAPKLRSWDVDAGEWKNLLAGIATVPLESITLRGLFGYSLTTILPELFAAAPRLSSLELFIDRSITPRLVLTDSLRSVTIHGGGQFEANLTRRDKGWEAVINVSYFANPEWVAQAVTEVLAPFPAERLLKAKLELPAPDKQRDRFEATVLAVRKVATEVARVNAR